MSSASVEVERIVLPRRLRWRDVDELQARLANTGARVLVLAGDDGAFCDGGVLTDGAPADAEPLRFAALLRAIEEAPRPVVAAVDGSVLGGGVGLAAAADVVLATPRSTFGLPEVLFGLVPAMVFPVLARRIGVGRARRMAMGFEPLAAGEAQRQGLVDELVDDLEAALARVTRRLLHMEPAAVAVMKSLVSHHFRQPAAYDADGARQLRERLDATESRARIRRFDAGVPPWSDENE